MWLHPMRMVWDRGGRERGAVRRREWGGEREKGRARVARRSMVTWWAKVFFSLFLSLFSFLTAGFVLLTRMGAGLVAIKALNDESRYSWEKASVLGLCGGECAGAEGGAEKNGVSWFFFP